MALTRTNWPDVDDVIALNADAEAPRDFGERRPMTPARVLAEEMPRLMAYNRRADRLGSWVARDRATGSFLGWFMIRPVDEPSRTVELTYRLRRSAWGRGYDIEGMLGIIEMARAAQVSTVVATMLAVNVAARRLIEQVGLRLVPKIVSETAGPTAAPASREVDYALDLAPEVGSTEAVTRGGVDRTDGYAHADQGPTPVGEQGDKGECEGLRRPQPR
jgi:RimJ/RimL family protein N-acetyltransferase